MDPQEITQKMDMIRSLTAAELAGWHRLVTGSAPFCRAPFEGEIAALHQRARQLGVMLTSSSPSAPSATTTATPPGRPGMNGSTRS